jgi:hypothetical protein
MISVQRFGSLRRPPRTPTDRFFVESLAPMALPPDSELRRTAPRPPELRGPDYEAKFDWTTIFYDIFWTNDQVVFVGPPFRNLWPMVQQGTFRLDGVKATPLATRELDRCQISSLPARARPKELSFESGGMTWRVPVRPAQEEVFDGCRVLLTLSRDNDLAWIADWVEFHARLHGADAVLIYDNASSLYTPEVLLDRVRSVRGIRAAVIVEWPFKHGPSGGVRDSEWDSDFSQYGMLEHSRRRFLQAAAAMLQADIDELVVSDEGRSLFDEAAQSRTGAILFAGQWIDTVRPLLLRRPRHRDFRHMNARFEPIHSLKWAAVPVRVPDHIQFKVHGFSAGFEALEATKLLYRHFKGISLDWFYPRSRRVRRRRSLHRVDTALVKQMRQIGWIR